MAKTGRRPRRFWIILRQRMPWMYLRGPGLSPTHWTHRSHSLRQQGPSHPNRSMSEFSGYTAPQARRRCPSPAAHPPRPAPAPTSRNRQSPSGFGVVYRTDALAAKLTVVDTAAVEMCGRAVYPAGVLKDGENREAAQAFLDYLGFPSGTHSTTWFSKRSMRLPSARAPASSDGWNRVPNYER